MTATRRADLEGGRCRAAPAAGISNRACAAAAGWRGGSGPSAAVPWAWPSCAGPWGRASGLGRGVCARHCQCRVCGCRSCPWVSPEPPPLLGRCHAPDAPERVIIGLHGITDMTDRHEVAVGAAPPDAAASTWLEVRAVPPLAAQAPVGRAEDGALVLRLRRGLAGAGGVHQYRLRRRSARRPPSMRGPVATVAMHNGFEQTVALRDLLPLLRRRA